MALYQNHARFLKRLSCTHRGLSSLSDGNTLASQQLRTSREEDIEGLGEDVHGKKSRSSQLNLRSGQSGRTSLDTDNISNNGKTTLERKDDTSAMHKNSLPLERGGLLSGDVWESKNINGLKKPATPISVNMLSTADSTVKKANLSLLMNALTGASARSQAEVDLSSIHVYLNELALVEKVLKAREGQGEKFDRAEVMISLLPNVNDQKARLHDLWNVFGTVPSVNDMKQVMAKLGKKAVKSDILHSMLIKSLGEAGQVAEAERIFESRIVSERDDLYVAMLSVYIDNGLHDKVQMIFEKARTEVSDHKHEVVANSIIAQYVANMDMENAKFWVKEVLESKTRIRYPVAVMTLAAFSKAGDFDTCELILGSTSRYRLHALNEGQRKRWAELNYNVLSYFGEHEAAKQFRDKHEKMLRRTVDWRSDDTISESSPDRWQQYFKFTQQELTGAFWSSPTVEDRNLQIEDLLKNSEKVPVNEVLSIYTSMLTANSRFKPNLKTYALVAKALTDSGRLESVPNVFTEISRRGFAPTISMYAEFLRASILRQNKNMIEFAMKRLRHLEHVATLEELEPIFAACEQTHDIDMIVRVASVLTNAHVYPSKRIVLSLFNSCVHKGDFVSGADLFRKWKENKQKLDVDRADDIVRVLATGGDLAGTVDALISLRNDAETGLTRQAYEALVDCFLRFGGQIESLPHSLRGRGPPTSAMHIILRNFLVTALNRKKAERPGVFKAFLKESIKKGSYDGVTLSFRLHEVRDLAVLGRDFPTWQREKIGGLQETFAKAMKVALDARRIAKAELVLAGTKTVRGLSPQVYHQVIRMRIMQGQREAAAGVLSEMESQGLHPLPQSVALLVESSDGENAAALLEKGRRTGLRFDEGLYLKVLEASELPGQEVQRVFSHMVRAKVFPSLRAFCALYASFSVDGGEREMRKFLQQLSSAENICDLHGAYELLQLGEYVERGHIMNWINQALRGPSPFGVREMMNTFHDQLPKGKVANLEFELHLKDGELDDARQSLQSLEKPRAGMYVRLLYEYTKRKQVDRAVSLYSEMGKRDIAKPLNVYKTLMGILMLFQKFEDAMKIADDFLLIESITPDRAFLRMCEIALKIAGSPTNYDIVSRVKERMGVDYDEKETSQEYFLSQDCD